MKAKRLISILTIAVFILLSPMTIYAHTHVWTVWTEIKALTCMVEGVQESSCDAPNCGQHATRNVAKVPHDYLAATCTKPKTCKFNCGTTTGAALGHSYAAATCVSPKTCTRCNATTGGLGSHNFSSATCYAPATCRVCNTTTGSTVAHNYTPATCAKLSTCRYCPRRYS